MRSIFGGCQEVEICGAKTRSGRPCQNPQMRPSGRCRMHGGKSYRGIASPRFKHGRYSRVWLVRFMERMQREPEKVMAETEAIMAELAAQPLDLDSLIAEPFPDFDPAVLEAFAASMEFDPAIFDGLLADLELPEGS